MSRMTKGEPFPYTFYISIPIELSENFRAHKVNGYLTKSIITEVMRCIHFFYPNTTGYPLINPIGIVYSFLTLVRNNPTLGQSFGKFKMVRIFLFSLESIFKYIYCI